MRIIFDASSLINLLNGNLLASVLLLSGRTFFAGPIVIGECRQGGVLPVELERQLQSDHIRQLDDSVISAGTFLRLIELYGLGDGETECLAFASVSDFVVSCDDRRARQMIAREVGAVRVTGSLGLLRQLVQDGMLSVAQAKSGYSRMRLSGAYLPTIGDAFFQ